MKPVVIIGGGITGLSAAWELQQQGQKYLLLEESGRLGGKILTDRVEGYILEGGADSFLTQKPAAWQLAKEIGLETEFITTNDWARKVYFLRGGRLHSFPPGMRLIVPTDPAGLLQSTLLSEAGKQRMLAETGIPPRLETSDESLGNFIRRRLGEEALVVFGEMLAGIYTGNPETLSMQATFPQYLAQERNYGSLIRASFETSVPGNPPGAPAGAFVSFRNGVNSLVEGLSAVLTGPIRTGVRVAYLDKERNIQTAAGEKIEAQKVIMATQAFPARQVLDPFFPTLAEAVGEIKALSTVIVSLGFEKASISHPLDGTGFLVAGDEPTHLRASTWITSKLPGRAPSGKVLIRAFYGGYRNEPDVFLEDAALVGMARTDLEKYMGITAQPVIQRVFRWVKANPQYEVGHLERIKRIRELCPTWLLLTGSPFEGVGIPDCVRQGREAARQILNR